MDFTKFDLPGLQSLHISYKRVLRDHIEQLENLPDDEHKPIMADLLKLKIASFQNDIKEIESLINKLNAEKLRFSVEYMEWTFGAFDKCIQVHFITTSNAYKTYGEYVTGTVILDKADLPALIEKVREGAHNDGVIRFEEIVSDTMPDEVKEKLRTEGFYASEIDSIMNLR